LQRCCLDNKGDLDGVPYYLLSRAASGIPGAVCIFGRLAVGSSLEPPLPISRLSFAVGHGYDVYKLRSIEIDD